MKKLKKACFLFYICSDKNTPLKSIFEEIKYVMIQNNGWLYFLENEMYLSSFHVSHFSHTKLIINAELALIFVLV